MCISVFISYTFPEVPGLAGWKAAIQAHAAAEGRLAPQTPQLGGLTPQQQPPHPVPGTQRAKESFGEVGKKSLNQLKKKKLG